MRRIVWEGLKPAQIRGNIFQPTDRHHIHASTVKSLFRHTTQHQVRNYEIDWQGIVHNANYLLFFELGRIEYLKHLGIPVNMNSIRHESRVVLVRNELDYASSAKFDDLLTIHTRVSFIKNTSFGFEGMIEDESTGLLVAKNLAIHVWLDGGEGRPMPVPESFRKVVMAFEGDNLKLIGSGTHQ